MKIAVGFLAAAKHPVSLWAIFKAQADEKQMRDPAA
jgi:hypothetical protein